MSGLDDGLRLCLLGRFELRAGERLLMDRGWRRTKSKALLKLLGLQQGSALHREQAMDLVPSRARPDRPEHRAAVAGRHAGAGDPGLRHGSRRTIGVAATAVAAQALLHPISILVRPVPGDLLQPAREEPWRSA